MSLLYNTCGFFQTMHRGVSAPFVVPSSTGLHWEEAMVDMHVCQELWSGNAAHVLDICWP